MDTLSLLKKLISIPSINPMGQKTFQGTEREVAECLENLLRREGIEVQRQAVEPDRENIIARVDVSPGSPRTSNGLLLNSHMDTVPVAHMTVDPFSPIISQGRVFGRYLLSFSFLVGLSVFLLDSGSFLPSTMASNSTSKTTT